MTEIEVFRQHRIGKIDRRIFGSFVEHMGRSIYGGIYDPQSKFADANGFRKDVIALVRDLGVSAIRYPGGNFLSGFDWKDSIGPKERRKAKLDLAWQQTEPNAVGIHEFSDWAKQAGSSVMLGVNMGNGTPREAAELVEYCNHPSGSYWSDLRAANGSPAPFDIRHWCLGNEMDGDWQMGTKTAEEYGRIAHESAKMMHWVDPTILLTACGSSNPDMPSYPAWDRVVLEHTYNEVDFISLHRYYEFPDHDKTRVTDFLASFVDLDRFIKTERATIDYVKALKRSKKQVCISVDEWNVWHTGDDDYDADRWQVGARRLENRYTALDAVVVAGLLMALLNNADSVKSACLAQLVNVIAPIFVDGEREALKQTIYYPFRLCSRYAKGETMHALVKTPTFSSVYGDAPLVYSATTYDEPTGELTVFLVNNDPARPQSVRLGFHEFGALSPTESTVLAYKDKFDINDFDARDRVRPVSAPLPKREGGAFVATVPPATFAVVRFREN